MTLPIAKLCGPKPKTYGELHVLGCNKSRKRCFVLEERDESHAAKRARTSEVHTSPEHETVLQKYICDEKYDVFQIGKRAPNIDFAVCPSLVSTVSTYACRIIVERADPSNVRVFAGACDADGDGTIQLHKNTVRWTDGELTDGFIKNGVLLLHLSDNGTYENSAWKEVSVRGKMFCMRPTRSSSVKSKEDEGASNLLKDWSLIDLCGVTLLFRTPESLRKQPTEEHLKQFIFKYNVQRSESATDTLVIPRSNFAPNKSSAAVCFKCGYLHQGNFLTMECPSCHKRGSIKRICMGMQRAFYVDAGNDICFENLCAICPCGHLTSEKTAKFWAQFSLPHGTNSFLSYCPFCFQAIESSRVKQRYVMSVMLLVAVLNIYTMRVCLSVAIVKMAKSVATNSSYVDPDRCSTPSRAANSPTQPPPSEADFDWSEAVQGVVLSSFYYGYIVSHIPGGVLADRFGGKHTLGLGILSTAITTVLSPVAAYQGVGYLIALRVIMGLGEGVTFPAVSVLLAHWVPPAERSRLGSFVFAGAQLGTVVGTALSGLLLQNYPWPVTFYFFGGLGVAWYLLWMVLCYSCPEEHPFITEEERDYLHHQIAAHNQGKPVAATPWRGILTSLPVWGLAVAQVGHDWGFFTMVTDLPKYMNSVLRFSIAKNGLLSALPYMVMWLCSMLFAAIADWIIAHQYWSVLTVRKFFTTLASVLPALGIIGASYAGCDEALVVVLFTAGMGGMGAFYPGMRVNGLDLSKHYAGTVMAVVNGLGAVSGMVSPILIGLLTPHSSLLEWRLTFWITFGVLLVSNLIYILTAEATVQPWDRQDHQPSAPGLDLDLKDIASPPSSLSKNR